MEIVRIGIVGMGNRGKGHADFLAAGEIRGAAVTAMCDSDPKALETAKARYPDTVRFFSDYKAMLASGACDAVIVATPHYSHVEISIAVLNAGLHLICEKPVSVFTKDVHELIDTAQKSGRVFTMMFNQRTHPVYRRIHHMIRDGELGGLTRIVWTITDWYRTQYYYDSGGWRGTWDGEGGGVLLNQCPHNIDLWQWMFGMPEQIWARCDYGKCHDIQVEDDVTVFMKYKNGATGVLITSTGEAPGSNRLEISGDLGKILYEDRGDTFTFWKNSVPVSRHSRESKQGFEKPAFEKMDITLHEKETAHRGIVQNFVNAIQKGEALIAPGAEGLPSLQLINAFLLSSHKNEMLTLPVDEDEYLTFLKEKIASTKK
jgi:predicted dehydrogenase